jgi:hypothetical protein
MRVITRAEYEKSVCHRLGQAKPLPFRKVLFADGSGPQRNCCHDNVDRWIKENPGSSALRGWVDYMPSVNGTLLTAHSVVREIGGRSFDITPLADERVRDTMRFVPHLGNQEEFHFMRKSNIFIECPGGRSNEAAPNAHIF